MVFDAVLGTVNEFIDYTLFLTGILIIYYLFRFFTIGGPSKEEKEKEVEERRKAIGDWWTKRKDKLQKEKEEREKRATEQKKETEKAKKEKEKKKQISPIIENLKDAIETCESIKTHLAKAERKLAHQKIQELGHCFEKALANLKLLRRHYETEDKDAINSILSELGGAQENFFKNIKGKLPKKIIQAKKSEWDTAVTAIEPQLKTVLGNFGLAWKNLEKFLKQ